MEHKGFTLIELILSMTLLAVLALMLIGNFSTTLKRGRDAQRKNDLSQLQKALELYYEDNKSYPTFTNIFNKKLCLDDNCGLGGTVYMVKTPTDPSSSKYTYIYYPEPVQNGISSYYYLYSYMENDLDQGQNINNNGFVNPGDASITACGVAPISVYCRYYVSSSNAPQLTPAP